MSSSCWILELLCSRIQQVFDEDCVKCMINLEENPLVIQQSVCFLESFSLCYVTFCMVFVLPFFLFLSRYFVGFVAIIDKPFFPFYFLDGCCYICERYCTRKCWVYDEKCRFLVALVKLSHKTWAFFFFFLLLQFLLRFIQVLYLSQWLELIFSIYLV